MIDSLDLSFQVPFIFKRRASPVPGDMRPFWRIAIILLILQKCGRKGTVSLKKLHILNWAIRTGESRKVFLDYLEGRATPDEVLFRVEPSLNRALDLLIAEGLVALLRGIRVTLTAQGLVVAKDITTQQECLESEKFFLDTVRSQVKEKDIKALMRWESTQWA